jgi:DNA-binding NtrC family response regulator
MKILLADDEKTIAVTLGDALRGAGHIVTVVSDGEQAISALGADTFDAVITDIRLPKADGLKVLARAKEAQPSTKVILITAYASVENAVKAIKDGAEDYVQKPFFNDDVLARLKKLERVLDLERENARLKEELTGRRQFGALVGKSAGMRPSTTSSSPSPRARSTSSSRARAAPARSSSPRPCTSTPRAAAARSSRCPAPSSPRPSSRTSSSAT